MPEYLAPGVYVEETSFRSKSIEGVSTTTTGFIGPTRYGPVDLEPDIITSVGEFERVYGDGKQLEFTTDAGVAERMDNYVWHAVRAFFEEGGKRLYVVRTFRPTTDKDGTVTDDGHSVAWLPTIDKPSATESPKSITVKARFPGKAGKIRVQFTVRLGQNVFGSLSDATTQVRPTVGGLQTNDIVWISLKGDAASGKLYRASKYYDDDLKKDNWEFSDLASSPAILHLERESIPDLVVDAHRVQVVTLTVTVFPEDPDAAPLVYADLPLDPQHGRQGARDSVADKFARRPNNLEQARSLPIIIELGSGVKTGLDLFSALNGAPGIVLLDGLKQEQSTDDARSLDLLLKGGNDGLRPAAAQYEGEANPESTTKTGLKAFEDIEDVSIIAAPGATYGLESTYQDEAKTIVNLLISHATRMRYRIAVLDSGDGQSISQVRKFRAKIDSTYAALYYPWVRVLDPITGKENYLPPSGFVAGIYARNDINRAVYKAPANEVVNGAIGFEHLLNKAQQDVLNPEGINCFRFFEGRGFRLWGARTISSDPEWKYVNVRRYFIYLERSIDRGTQWAVFEPNGEALWANIRRTVEDFLLNEWQMGALLGDKPEKAYFVKCDRSTMTQNDLDNGRLVCLIGVAPLRPAEFVIFRIGQWTADRRL